MLKKIKIEDVEALCEDKEKTLEWIANTKWEKGFVCRKCGNDNYCQGKALYSRRCTRCKTEESATAHTLFHNVKFPVNKAFRIAYNVCVLKKDISSYCYADELQLNQMTCWKFNKRIRNCLSSKKAMGANSISDILLIQEE